MKKSCGIDFGTTNTSTAVIDSVFPKLVPVENEKITIPSALFFSNSNIYFGREAMELYTQGEDGRCMRSLKRVLGTDLMKMGTLINNKPVKFQDILTYFIKHIKFKIDSFAGENIKNVVMGRPVHFIDNNPDGDFRAEQELKEIALLSGFKNVEFQYEPIAAAFAHEKLVKEEKLACVIDVGGGTSDFTIIKIGQNLIKKSDRTNDILASSGVRVGGNDFDKNLAMKCFMPELGYGSETTDNKPIPSNQYWNLAEWSKINNLYNIKELRQLQRLFFLAEEPEKIQRLIEIIEQHEGHKFLTYIEKAKFNLTEVLETRTALDFLSDSPIVYSSRKDFEDSLQNDIKKIKNSLFDCIKMAKIKPEQIELIILTGGSTEIPIIQKTMTDIFPKAEISQGNKLSSVGLGLAYDSARKFGIMK